MKGGCACGSIRYEITGETVSSGLCYCKSCQKATGSGYWPFIFLDQSSLKIEGELLEYRRPAASGSHVTMSFCGTCGSTVFGRPELWEGMRTISASSLDNPNLFAPQFQLWTVDKPDWAKLRDDLPSFNENPVAADDS